MRHDVLRDVLFSCVVWFVACDMMCCMVLYCVMLCDVMCLI